MTVAVLLLWPRWDTGYKVWVWQVVYHQGYCVCFYMFKDIQFKIYKRCSTCGYVKHRYVSYHYILYYRILITKTIVLYGRRFMAEILFDLTLNNPFIDRWFFIMSLIIIYIKCSDLTFPTRDYFSSNSREKSLLHTKGVLSLTRGTIWRPIRRTLHEILWVF